MNIRVADRYDIEEIITMMEHFSEHSPILELRHNKNEAHVRSLIIAIIMGAGMIWLAERKVGDNTETCGMLVAIRQPSMWNPAVMLMSELAYWVEPEHRGGSTAYRLLKAYERWGDSAVERGEITGYTISRLHSSQFDPQKLGYTMIEQTYLKQGAQHGSN